MIRSTIGMGLLMIASIVPPAAVAQVIVAHRGASHDAPENTLAAFNLAWQQGSDGIEGDFYLTGDGQIVCIHDKTTERTTGVDLTVEHTHLEQLRTLDAGRWKDAAWSGERIPTFEEVHATVPPGKLFVIELKSKSAIVPVLASELKRLDSREIRLLIISFDEATIRECKRRLPEIPAHWLTKFEQRFSRSYHPTAAHVAATVRRCRADGVGMKGITDLIDRTFVDRLRADGCDIFHVWTIDSPDEARHFQALGAYGITTNRPLEIARALQAAASP